jgi:hypothetical protein
VAIRDDGFDVLITGIGTLRYARDKLLPRRPLDLAAERERDLVVVGPCKVGARFSFER